MRTLALAIGVAAVLAGCVPGAPSTTPGAPLVAAWQQVALPDGVRPAALAVAGADLLVGGLAVPDPTPRLLRLADGGVAAEFTLAPADPNAAVADLVHLTASGDDVYAIGTMIAGAHANPRLTVWDGSLASATLASRPQEFFTFGGHDAGPLLGTVVTGAGPVIVGSRAGAYGPFGVAWTRSGHTWRQQPSDPVLASTPDRVLGFGGATGTGDRIVVVGDELGLAGGLRQRPVVFTGTGSGDWRQGSLPLPDEPGSGGPARAATVACSAAGCWVAGWGRGHPLAWPVAVDAAGTPSPGPVVVLPGEPAGGNDPTALVALTDSRPVVLTNAAAPSTQLRCADGWRTVAGPPGRATALATVGDRAFAVADGVLWRLAVPAC